MGEKLQPAKRVPAKKLPAETLARLVVESAPNALIMVGQDGRIILANPQAEKLFGYPQEELIGQTIEVLVPMRSRKVHTGYRSDFFARPETRAMGAGRDLFGLRKDGSEVPVEIGLNPVKTKEGQFVLASIIDITQRRVLEKKLAHAETLATVGGMVTVVAHEIRNPLGSIVLAAKAMAKGGLSREDQDQVMSVLVNESQRLNRNLEDFLQYARPREPKLQLGDLNATTHEVLAAVRSDDNIVGAVVVDEVLDKNLPQIPYDADQIRQVLWNVIRNGFQAMKGQGKLEVRTEAKGKEAFVHVKDTGQGMAPEQLEKIFIPFYTTKAKGTGLGLSISRNIILAHGGNIQIQSRPGRGSRFSIILPIQR